jgi:putative Mg2+ transporter-C (MgtC) family protein
MSVVDVNEWTAAARVVGSAVFGGIVGWDRESRHKTAGTRTHMMVAAGACVFVVTAVLAFDDEQHKAEESSQVYLAQNPDRILAGIATGVGFLGGGTIIKTEGNIQGLTTAAGLWTVAGIGASIAYGRWILGAICTALAVFIQISDFLYFIMLDRVCKKKRDTEEPPASDTGEVREENKEKTSVIIDEE